MTPAERNIIYYGSPEDLPEQIPLRAGPLSMVFEAGDLRYIRCGAHELIRRIYSAVRDRNWGTIPAQFTNLKIDSRADSFEIAYDVQHKQREIDFVWKGKIIGENTGRITFRMDGKARSTFLRNRIGFCVLHPMDVAGRQARSMTGSGEMLEKAFPKFIARHAPEEVPFRDMESLAWEYAVDAWARLDFEGDLFETEDQRNWIDASFKTFCTPLRLPFPVEIKEGTVIQQSVTLSLETPAAAQIDATTEVVEIQIGEIKTPLPKIGFGLPVDQSPLTTVERNRLRACNPAHLRIDLRFAAAPWAGELAQAQNQAAEIGSALEVVLHLNGTPDEALRKFADAATDLRISRIMVFHDQEKTTSAKWVELARTILSSLAVPIGGGSNAYFTELNRDRSSVELLDFISYSVNPQVHAFDNTSLVETLAAHVPTVESTRQFAPGIPLCISPITLKPRFNPDATGPAPGPLPGELPSQVDPRQMSLFGAVWTLGSLKYVAEAAVDSVTYFETVGWKGLMECEGGSMLPGVFHSHPGMVFPMYHIFADVAEFTGGTIVHSTSSTPLKVLSLVLQKGAQWRVLVANLTKQPQTFRAPGIPADVRMKFLNEKSFEAATRLPEEFRQKFIHTLQPMELYGLRPFEIITFDWTA